MGNIRVGKQTTKPDAPAHTPGVTQGNEPGGIEGIPASTKQVSMGQGVLVPSLRPANQLASTPRRGTR
jgi:hypothetical protein